MNENINISSMQIPDSIAFISSLEDMLWGMLEENAENYKNHIIEVLNQRPYMRQYCISTMYDVVRTKPKSYTYLMNLLNELNLDMDTTQKFIDFSNSISDEERLIIKDNLDEFIEKFDFQSSSKEKIEAAFSSAAKNGSINIFKYLIVNSNNLPKIITNYAVIGGEFEIIRILTQKGKTFDNCLLDAVQAHNNDIADWLMSSYQCELLKVSGCLHFHNLRAALFCIGSKYDINEKFYTSLGKTSALFYACEMMIPELIEYLIENGADTECGRDEEKYEYRHIEVHLKTPLYYSVEKGWYDIVRLLVEKGANVNGKYNILIYELVYDAEERTTTFLLPLDAAIRNKNKEIEEFLRSKGAESKLKI